MISFVCRFCASLTLHLTLSRCKGDKCNVFVVLYLPVSNWEAEFFAGIGGLGLETQWCLEWFLLDRLQFIH